MLCVEPNLTLNQKKREMNLEELLQWAKRMSLFIEIRGNGSAEVQMLDHAEDYVFLSSGNTLKEALEFAHSKFVT
jgi:hypothetical protein